MPRFRTLALALLLALAPASLAQSLRPLLPDQTLLALGTQGLSAHRDQLQPFLDELDRLGVAAAFQDAFGGAEQSAESAANVPDLSQLPSEFQGLNLLDVIGDEAWVALSVSSYNPLPAVTLVARVDAKAEQAFASAIAANADQAGVQALTEGSQTFYVVTADAGDGMSSPVAYAQDGALVALSSNPDVLRGVLRRHQGADEPNFTTTDAYASTLGTLGDGVLYGFVHVGPAGDVLSPLVKGQGFDTLADRLSRLLTTIGTSAGVTRITADGVETDGVQALDGTGQDLALYNLLSSDAPASLDPLAFVPQGALGVQSSAFDLTGWWNYLGDLVSNAPELGIGDLDQFLQGMVGIDLRQALFDWSGTQVGSITTGAPTVVDPGMPASDLLGESVLMLQATDESAAQQGLSQLFTTVATQVAGFTDPSGSGASANVSTRDVGGVTVTSYGMGPGITLSYAVTDGYALIGTSDAAMDAVLQARSGSAALPPTLAAMRAAVPQGAHSFALADERASLEATASSIAGQVQTMAGLGGSAGLDFDKVQKASAAIEQFVQFVAARTGGAVRYSQVADGVITSHGMTQVSW